MLQYEGIMPQYCNPDCPVCQLTSTSIAPPAAGRQRLPAPALLPRHLATENEWGLMRSGSDGNGRISETCQDPLQYTSPRRDGTMCVHSAPRPLMPRTRQRELFA
jgi:hypothetical protein